jgi:hypothetical protein
MIKHLMVWSYANATSTEPSLRGGGCSIQSLLEIKEWVMLVDTDVDKTFGCLRKKKRI